jgi:hypothetical protein
MGLLDSIQNTLFKQSSIGQRYKAQAGTGSSEVGFPSATPPVAPTARMGALNPVTGIGKANPFLMSNDLSTSVAQRGIGQNKPLEQPMFIGYHNEKPIYGGGKVFILV